MTLPGQAPHWCRSNHTSSPGQVSQFQGSEVAGHPTDHKRKGPRRTHLRDHNETGFTTKHLMLRPGQRGDIGASCAQLEPDRDAVVLEQRLEPCFGGDGSGPERLSQQ